jgi:hypothetical protein
VIKFDISLEDAALLTEALVYYKQTQSFVTTASQATEEERAAARHKIARIDHMLRMDRA